VITYTAKMSRVAQKNLLLTAPLPKTVAEPGAGTPGVGRRVHALREAMGLSLRDLAERCGVSAPMLSQVERGETSPTLAVAGGTASRS
jgi:predicted transcriptional regulator